MFNFFKKEKETNPISMILNDLTLNQKKSVINLLLTIGVCDPDQSNPDLEIQYLNSYIDILDVRQDMCMQYLQEYGQSRIINDLKTISKNQKEFLVAASWDMIICDGQPNEIELQVTIDIFEQIGITEDNYIGIIQKTQAIAKQFSNN